MVVESARGLPAMAANLSRIVSIDLVCAAQGVSFRAPLATSAPLAAAMTRLRAEVLPPVEDRALDRDLKAAVFPVRDENLVRAAGVKLPHLGPDHPNNESAA